MSDTVRHQATTVVFEDYVEPAFNYRMTDLQAAVGRPQLARLDAIVAERRRLADRSRAAFADHPALANQLFAAYARANRVRLLASAMGREGLSAVEARYLEFGDAFERRLVHQTQGRTLEESMAPGWQMLRLLPAAELTRLNRHQLVHYIEGAQDA